MQDNQRSFINCILAKTCEFCGKTDNCTALSNMLKAIFIQSYYDTLANVSFLFPRRCDHIFEKIIILERARGERPN